MFEFLIATANTATSLGGPAEIWAAIVKDFSNIGEPAAFAAFIQVLLIDLGTSRRQRHCRRRPCCRIAP
jgi:hypothetical protein